MGAFFIEIQPTGWILIAKKSLKKEMPAFLFQKNKGL